jgi:hypothetical protein
MVLIKYRKGVGFYLCSQFIPILKISATVEVYRKPVDNQSSVLLASSKVFCEIVTDLAMAKLS